MLWLAELGGRLAWEATDGGVRFVVAMIVIGANVVALGRIVRWTRARIETALRR
ncbi:MAG TPA: hypothetical protein VEA16_08375 [Vicinamibacterales bacterium]|nr:hypothetical protein [Vicinamibacterales bacterium]